jgi:LemA protein
VERYPELKANANFRDLQSQLEGTENRIAVERQRYNQARSSTRPSDSRRPRASMSGFKAGVLPRAGSEAPA